MRNEIYVRRRSYVLLPEGEGTTPWNMIASLQKNLEALGFHLEEAALARLAELPQERVVSFYQGLIKDLRALVGAHRVFAPMYPNFPWQVMDMTEAELYLRAVLHYHTLQLPAYEARPRPSLEEKQGESAPAPLPWWQRFWGHKDNVVAAEELPSSDVVQPAQPVRCRVLRAGSRDDFEGILSSLVRSKSSFSATDQQDVRWFVAQYGDGIARLLPEQVPCKENLAFVGAQLLRRTTVAEAFLDPRVQTATDVLRLAVALSDGDVSLAQPGKFGRFARSHRVLLLRWIERAEGREEDMRRRKPRWVRLGERLHPGEYAKRYPRAAAAFDGLRNGQKVATFAGAVETALQQRDLTSALDLLERRPGEFARRLDHVLRSGAPPAELVARFATQAGGVATPVLLQVMTHFRHRDEPAELRAFFPKGNVANVFARAGELPPLPAGAAAALAGACEQTLLARFARLAPLGHCFLDERLRSYLVPFSQRSASKALRTLVRGSRVPLPGGSTLRFFVWWKNGRSRTDIDLSAAMFDGNFGYVDTLAYYNLKNFGAHHSGDIVDAPNGAAEFIDVDVARCREKQVRYVVMCLNSFTSQPYCDLPECFAGWMSRHAPNSGEIFEPKTVVDKVDLAADTAFALPVVFDLEAGEAIWADVALKHEPRFANNVHHNLGGVSLMLRVLKGLRKTSLYDLFSLHVRARGTRVNDRTAARTVFAVDEGITPFDLPRIGAEYLLRLGDED